MGKGGNKGKRGKKGNDSKKARTSVNKAPIPFRLLDLPIDLLEDVAELLKDQYQHGTLANLNVSNKYLREVTNRFLWESVRWTKDTWQSVASSLGQGIPEIFQHIKYIHLIDLDDFDDSDREFWTPLFERPLPQLETKSFAQIAHIFFPNLKYVMKFCPPPARGSDLRRGPPNARVYISDHNVISKFDTAVFRKLILEFTREYFGRKSLPFPCLSDPYFYPSFGIEMLNRRYMASPEARIRERLTREVAFQSVPEDPEHRRWQRANLDLPLEIMPFRHAALLSIGARYFLRLDLLTEAPMALKDSEAWMRRKALDMFWLFRHMVEREIGDIGSRRLGIMVDTDLSPNPEPYDEPDMDRVKRWIDLLASYTPLRQDDRIFPPFNMYTRLPQEVDLQGFHSTVLELYAFLKAHFARSDFNSRHALPIYFQLRAFPDISNTDEELTARMDFSSVESSRDICVGYLYSGRCMYKVQCFYRDGVVNNDQAQRAGLERRFFAEWPGVPGHLY